MNEVPTPIPISHHPAETATHVKASALAPLRLKLQTTGEVVEIAKASALVGRHAEADLRLAAPDISRRHCRIAFEDGLWRMRDLGSTNGVFVNGYRLQEAVLYSGDLFAVGSVEFLVERATTQRAIRGKGHALESIARAVAE